MAKKKKILILALVVAVSAGIVAVLSHKRAIISGDAEVGELEKQLKKMKEDGVFIYDEEGLTREGEKLLSKFAELGERKKTPPRMLRRFASKRTPPFMRHLIAELIMHQKDPAAVDTLLKVLKDKTDDGWARGDAAVALGEIGDKRTIGPLIETLNDENEHVREYAVRGLVQFDDERVIDPLLRMLKSKNVYTRLIAVRGLSVDNPKVVDALIDLVKNDPDRGVRGRALRSLAATKEEKAFQTLMGVVQNEKTHPFEKADAVYALGKMADKRAVEPLIKILEEDKGILYIDAAIALGEIGDKRALEPLEKKMEEKKNKKRAMKELSEAYRKLRQESGYDE